MRRNIALFIDGTENDGRDSSKTPTNMWKFHEARDAVEWDKGTNVPETTSSIRPDVKALHTWSRHKRPGFQIPGPDDRIYRSGKGR
jgi:hypothetical protein